MDSTSLKRLLAFLAFLLCAARALAFEAPAFQGDVLDEAGILSTADQETLRERIRGLREGNGIWAAIYVAKDLQQEPIESAAVAVFEKWQLGEKGKDNGLLVMIAPAERKMRIEVGYGLEGEITDAFSKRVIDEIYKPAFRERRYADGLMQGFDAMVKAVGGEALPAAAPQSPAAVQEIDWSQSGLWFAIGAVLNLLPALLYTLAAIRGRRQGRGEARTLWQEVQTPVLVFGFLALFFGLFFAVFGGAASGDEDPLPFLGLFNLVFAGVFALPFGLQARRYLSAAAYQRYRERRSSGGGSSDWDPESRSRSRSDSWSDSDSSDSSSSSGGGSSGGGGASGDW